MMRNPRPLIATALAALGLAILAVTPAPADNRAAVVAPESVEVRYRAAEIDGTRIAYREAGDPAMPTVLLLHGFPTSSHMFRNLIPRLAGRYHVIAPD